MPIISFSSYEDGAGKTTAATLLATELADRGAAIVVIDANPNKNVVDWASLPGKPKTLCVVDDVGEETIVDAIEAAAAKAAFVVVDLEGAKNLMASYAISMSDFVVIPVQDSQLAAKQAMRQAKFIKAQERIVQRKIPFAGLFTRLNPALQGKTPRHLEPRFAETGVPVLVSRLYDRAAFRAIFSFGGSLASLGDKGGGDLAAAKANARDFAAEMVARLRGSRREAFGATNKPDRVDPLARNLVLSEFQPLLLRKSMAANSGVREASEAQNLPCRAPNLQAKPASRRWRTGRNVQLNIKATAKTIARFTALADRRGMAFGELLEQFVAMTGD